MCPRSGGYVQVRSAGSHRVQVGRGGALSNTFGYRKIMPAGTFGMGTVEIVGQREARF